MRRHRAAYVGPCLPGFERFAAYVGEAVLAAPTVAAVSAPVVAAPPPRPAPTVVKCTTCHGEYPPEMAGKPCPECGHTRLK